MTVQVTVTKPVGSSAGPFDIYTDADGYYTPIASATFAELQVGVVLSNVPDNASIIRVQSISGCTNYNESYITSIPICESTPILEKQMWMGCNLNVTTYSDGTEIPKAANLNAFYYSEIGCWMDYNDDPANGEIYGKLYNWEAVIGKYDANSTLRKKLAPDGWRVPSVTDLGTLVSYSGGLLTAGNRLKETGDYHWLSNNTAINLNGFTALPGGVIDIEQDLGGLGYYGAFWSSTKGSQSYDDGYYLTVTSGNTVILDVKGAPLYAIGASVRCISDTVQVYPRCGDVEIGDQTWSKCNLNTTKYQNGDPIPFAIDAAAWQQYAAASMGAWCYPNFSQSTGDTFQKLYNWWAVNDTANDGLIPVGYRLPTATDFEVLAVEAGGVTGATTCGPKLREQGTRYWAGEAAISNLALAANNLTQFTAFPSGSVSNAGVYSGTTVGAVWWTSEAGTTAPNRKVCRLRPSNYIPNPNSLSFDLAFSPSAGAAVRLIKI